MWKFSLDKNITKPSYTFNLYCINFWGNFFANVAKVAISSLHRIKKHVATDNNFYIYYDTY